MTVALVLASALVSTCTGLDAGGSVGVELERSSTGSRAVGLTLAALAGAALDDCLSLPVRAEVALGSTTLGPPWGAGVDAVTVGRALLDLGAVAGPSLRLLDHLGAELLVGGALETQLLTLTALGKTRHTYSLSVRPKGFAGAFVETGRLRFALRAGTLGLSTPRLSASLTLTVSL